MKISQSTKITYISENFPHIAKYLEVEWGFHCMNCIMAGFDTLESAALIHDIQEEDLAILLKVINDMVEVNDGELKDYENEQKRVSRKLTQTKTNE